MKKVLCMLLAAAMLLGACPALAVKAPYADRYDYMAHLQYHLYDECVKCTGNYVKVRTQPNGSKVLGHLEIADTFYISEISDHWAYITVTYADRTSPDSFVGLSGWVNAEYIHCGCSESAYDDVTAAAYRTAEERTMNAFDSYDQILDAVREEKRIGIDQWNGPYEFLYEPYAYTAELGYVMMDINRDGTDELLIMEDPAIGYDSTDGIYVAYTMADGRPCFLFKGWGRNRHYLLTDGTVYNEGSDGAAYGMLRHYALVGTELRYLEGYASSDYGPDSSSWGWFRSPDGNYTQDVSLLVSNEEAYQWEEAMLSLVDSDLNWQSLVE